ncbi:ABC transporter substrate-binding protein [Pseudonocardia adelaidensis]|uniref:Extracellular solute-binding protein n=1 Tax=Pseudonocardia adelaidensis TaxID=648754 RepID=A0ABP9NXI9_9PSEU
MTTFSRRQVLGASAAAVGAAAFGVTALAASRETGSGTSGSPAGVPEETRSLDQLYAAAMREGGALVVYAGGDTAGQQNGTEQAFRSRFPGVGLTTVVDYSKYHDVRVDSQIANGAPLPDVVQLQTLHDFPSWKEEGLLLPYKPAGFSALHDGFKDPDGTWLAIAVTAFSFMYDSRSTGTAAPRTPPDLVDARWKGRIASSYPQDDDAVLFLYRQYVHEYGWDWAARLATQNVRFARGTHTPGAAVAAGQKAIGIGGAAPHPGQAATTRWVAGDDIPFLGWGQRAAILAGAEHPEAAKLYLNWLLSTEVQHGAANGWSVRTDVPPADGLRPIWEYPNAHVDHFAQFMADRAEVERWRQTFTLYFGEVQGPPSTGWLGMQPGAPPT